MTSLRIAAARIRYWFRGDRIVHHRVVETTVMGRGATLTTALFMVPVACTQLWSDNASRVVQLYGGTAGSALWGVALLLASLLVILARLCKHPRVSLVFEIPGTALLGLTVVVFGFAVLGQQGLDGSIFAIALALAKGLNLFGRAFMLTRRSRASWVVNQQLKGFL